MKITVVGCGNAFSDDNFNQSFLLEEDGRKMLIDCGYQVPLALRVNRIDLREINDIYVSHLHADHIGGNEFIKQIGNPCPVFIQYKNLTG